MPTEDHHRLHSGEIATNMWALINKWANRHGEEGLVSVPPHLRPSHLLDMCQHVNDYLGVWTIPKLHRRCGIIIGIAVAMNYVTKQEADDVVNKAKHAFPLKEDEDLRDHNLEDHPFELDLGCGD